MSRGLSSPASAAVQAEVVMRTCAVDLDFSSGPVRLNGSLDSIFIGGEEFFGVGSLGGISVVEETAELRSQTMSLALAGIPRDAVAIALTEGYQGRQALIYEVVFDRTTGAVIGDPVVIFRGRIDQMNVTLGDFARVELRVEDRMTDWERAPVSRYTDEDQQRRYPGDLGFQFVVTVVNKDIVWPNRAYLKKLAESEAKR